MRFRLYRRRRRPFYFRCALCGNRHFTATVGLVRRRYDRLPELTSLGSNLRCTECGFITGYQIFVDQHRGWL